MTDTTTDPLESYLAQLSREELLYIADHGPDTRTRRSAYDRLQDIELENPSPLEKLRISKDYVAWANDEIQRQAGEARGAAQAAGYIWDYWVESDMANTAGMQAEHARRFPDCAPPKYCPHIRY